jgi:hypothetical protein
MQRLRSGRGRTPLKSTHSDGASQWVRLAVQGDVPFKPAINGLAHEVVLGVPGLDAGGMDGVGAALWPFHVGYDELPALRLTLKLIGVSATAGDLREGCALYAGQYRCIPPTR